MKIDQIDGLSRRLLELETKLNSNIPTTLWISDLHGEGDRFKSILRGRFGMLYQTCIEALPRTFSPEKIQYLVKVIRKKGFIEDPEINLDRQDVIVSFAKIVKYKLSNVDYDFNKVILPEYRDMILRMISGHPVPDLLFENQIISDRIIFHLSYTIKQVLLDRILVLGDIFDRGSQPDKIIRILSSNSYRQIVRLVFGNHDILWMGAAAGNQSLIAEAMRITCRYDHFKLIQRLGFDTSLLESFAQRTYPVDKVTGFFKAKTDRGRSMEKALAIIQFKLEEKTINKHPEFEMDSRLWLKKLSKMLQSGKTKGLNDTFFPTINPKNPTELTEEEEQIIADLTQQFTNNGKLKKLLRFFFQRGETYCIHNNLLNIHALIPSTKNGEFDQFLGRKGKALLDFIQKSIQRLGVAYLAGETPDETDSSLMFYLWCGPKSPFFGKIAMKTFERYFLIDKSLHKEPSLYWKSNLEKADFKKKIMREFEAERVIFGHTPVDFTKGKSMADEEGIAINIDGGFAKAYYNRGHALVQTPHQLYGIILPTPDEIKKASDQQDSIPLSVEVIHEFNEPVKLKHTSASHSLKTEIRQILEQLHEYELQA